MRKCRFAVAIALVCLGCPAPATGQEVGEPPSRDWWLGGSVGFPGSGLDLAGLELLTTTFHAHYAARNKFGFDFAAGTFPRIAFDGIAGLVTRVGATMPFGSDRILLWPSAGLSGLAVNYEDEAVTRGGGYAGLAATVSIGDSSSGLRVGGSAHKLSGGNDLLWFAEIGFMWRR